MKRAASIFLAAGAVCLCVGCYSNEVLNKADDNSLGEADFTTGSMEDCTAWSPRTNEVTAGQFDGVDMLVVVDNSGSMAEEQQLLGEGFFTLINALTKPMSYDETSGYEATENIRLAVVSSDLGLSYGEARETALSPTQFPTCESLLGDDGAFLTESGVPNVELPDGTVVDCTSLSGDYAESSSLDPNADLAVQAACAAQQGTSGCGIEQPLEAAVAGLRTHTDFISDSHLLTVLMVSDEEDCSIEDPALFSTPEWLSATELNIACNVSAENEANLFPTSRYYDEFVALKGGKANAVIFAAIVGVPTNEDSAAAGTPNCEGSVGEIAACLSDNPAMTLVPMEFTDPMSGTPFVHFAPACERLDETSETAITTARPGRRYVEVASDFGSNGLVYSICNEDWAPAMLSIAEKISRQFSASCYPKQMEWEPLETQPAACEDESCGQSTCDMTARIPRALDDSDDCPAELYGSLSDEEKEALLSRKSVVPVENTVTGEIILKNIFCPIPKLPTPKDCASARLMVNEDSVGWYYCEDSEENFEVACTDGFDNDDDGSADCEDIECADCGVCGGEGCDGMRCSYNVRLTQAASTAVASYFVRVECMDKQDLPAEECQADPDASLGSSCVQPGFTQNDSLYAASSFMETISFQDGCDCMTHFSFRGIYEDSEISNYSHFCTRPCDISDDDCPAGFVCDQSISGTFDIPSDMSHAYCIPECLAEPCADPTQYCLSDTAAGDTWSCQ